MRTTLAARTVARATLPVVDIAALSDPDPAARNAVAAELKAACEDKGFLYITGHGVAQASVDGMFAHAAAFFALPMEQKLALSLEHSACKQGYEKLKGQRLEAGTPPDLKEGYYMGREVAADDSHILTAPGYFGPNQWPDCLPGFQTALLAYYADMRALAERLLRGLALSLQQPEDFFTGFCGDPLARLRLLHYPPQAPDADPDQKGAGAHTDYGALTILAQDTSGGLQVQDKANGDWIHADPLSGCFVVNLGDMMQRWTNGRYRSTLHRVVNVSGRDRYSIPFFYHGTLDHVVTCIPTCLPPGEAPRHPPVKVADHFKERMRESYTP